MNNLARRISVLESETDTCGVVVVSVYDGETREVATTKHVATGGADPASAEILVIINKPGKRPAREVPPIVIRQSSETDLAVVIAKARARVAKLNAQWGEHG